MIASLDDMAEASRALNGSPEELEPSIKGLEECLKDAVRQKNP